MWSGHLDRIVHDHPWIPRYGSFLAEIAAASIHSWRVATPAPE